MGNLEDTTHRLLTSQLSGWDLCTVLVLHASLVSVAALAGLVFASIELLKASMALLEEAGEP